MATPIKSLFPPIEKNPFLLNKQKSRSRRPTSCIDRMATPLGIGWGWANCLCLLFICSFLSLFIFGHLFYLHYLFYAISTVILFNFSFHHMHTCYLFVYSHTSRWTHKSSGPELVLFKVRKERFKWQVWLMSTDAHLDFRLDCNSPYATSIVEFFSPTHVV